jgi:hypothetical protein
MSQNDGVSTRSANSAAGAERGCTLPLVTKSRGFGQPRRPGHHRQPTLHQQCTILPKSATERLTPKETP